MGDREKTLDGNRTYDAPGRRYDERRHAAVPCPGVAALGRPPASCRSAILGFLVLVEHFLRKRRPDVPLPPFFGRTEGAEVFACLPQVDVVRTSWSFWGVLSVDLDGPVVLPAAYGAQLVFATASECVISAAGALMPWLHCRSP